MAQLKSEAQPGSAVKGAFSLEGSCPMASMAPVLAIVLMAAGVVLKKENGPTPLRRLCSFRQPGRAKLNSAQKG